MRPWAIVEAEVGREKLAADNLPSNHDLPNDVTTESLVQGWTVQQPWEHRHYPVDLLLCVLCGQQIGPNELARGMHDCPVLVAVGG